MWLALLSAVVFALKDVVSKEFFSKYDISPSQILFENFFIAVAFLLLFLFPAIQFELFYQYWHLFVLKSFFLGLSSIVYIMLLKQYEVSSVSPLLNLSPFFVLVLATIFLGEVISFIQFIGIVIILIATYILELHTTHHTKKFPHIFHINQLLKKPTLFFIKVFVVLIAAGSATITDRIILEEGVSVITALYFTSLIIFLVLSVYFIKEKIFFERVKKLITEPQTIIIGAIRTLDLGVILYAIAQPAALVSIIIPLRRTSTLLSSLFGGMLFHESHLQRKLFSTVLMIIGVIFIVV